ncbi:MAG: TlpA family protein disulfide reductase [Chromatiaceae bacterium]|nr:TlpA family protein disulfide reductase [Gammaproteobacteria bacterium]MCP5300236.1 TlpA family protein disulfide reductase [Chromatiaceae bacterium]MCP5422308.1 TlpA family protein disulfide reductase [Chromatiaceae bacterium]
MNIRNYFLIAVGGAVIGAASGFALRAFDDRRADDLASPVPVVREVDQLPAFAYRDLEGKLRNSSEFADKVVVLNFWATWCPPCRKETPEFVAMQDAFNNSVQFIGIAIDDAEPVREFANGFKMNYPVLLGDVDAVALSRRLGNRYEGLPFTVVMKPGGNVVLRHAGGIERGQLEPLLRELTTPG